jgi:hypothetical protein
MDQPRRKRQPQFAARRLLALLSGMSDENVFKQGAYELVTTNSCASDRLYEMKTDAFRAARHRVSTNRFNKAVRRVGRTFAADRTDDTFEVLYLSLWKDRWASTGPFGRTVLSIDDALRFIAYEDIS